MNKTISGGPIATPTSGSTTTTRTRPTPAPIQLPFNDLITQWTNLATSHIQLDQQTEQTRLMQEKLETVLSHRRRLTQIQQQQKQRRNTASMTDSTSTPSNSLPEGFEPIQPITASPPSTIISVPSIDATTLLASRHLSLAARRANLARLSLKLTADQANVHALRTAVLTKRQALIPKVNLIQQLQSTTLAHRKLLSDEKKKLEIDLRVQLYLLNLRCCFRRRLLLHHLQSIYPISPPRTALKSSQTQHPLMCYTIRGLRLPNNFNNILTSFDEEQVSTALGYVCHLLLMLSKYLEVPLRYRMLYRGSRSVICDDVTASSQFPLYFKNMEERRFEIGVILLNKNIEHLLHVRLDPSSGYAKHVRELTFTLENLDLLFKSEIPQ